MDNEFFVKQIWNLKNDALGKEDFNEWDSDLIKKLKHVFRVQGLSGDEIGFEEKLILFGIGWWLSLANEVAFRCSLSPLSYAKNPATVCLVIDAISDFCVLFCFNVLRKLFYQSY